MGRPVWKGSISFGLVSVPVEAYSAVRDHDVHFHQLDRKSGSRIHHRNVAEATGDEVPAEDIVLGFEVSKGEYVTFESDEVSELRPHSTRAIEITDFVALSDIDPIYYDRTYWLAPEESGLAAYQLLLAAMEERERVGIGSVVMRTKQYLTAVRPLDGALAMSTMRFADEVVPKSDVERLPDRRTEPDERAMRMATQLLDGLTAPWDPEQYRDTYTTELRKRIEAKQAGKQLTEPEPVQASAKVIDLMAALQASLDGARSAKPPASAAKRDPAPSAAAKKSSAKKAARAQPAAKKTAGKTSTAARKGPAAKKVAAAKSAAAPAVSKRSAAKPAEAASSAAKRRASTAATQRRRAS